ncbi:hypothetical protein ACIQNG_32815 [Streptomyces sp. NPDC091377]|uniref:hypothetical protein n=1 Tax=Streptomyces sp. NPDC091377 TaxID=3365995 RepID=UPI003800B622
MAYAGEVVREGGGRGPSRWAAVAVGAVVALSACGGDGGGGDGAPDRSPKPSPTTSTGGGTGALEGSWATTSGDGKAVALIITGTEAGLFATGGTVCSGTAGESDGERVISLRCTDGRDERTSGTVDSVDGTTLTVTWRGGLGAETYAKAEGGKLPSGLPSAVGGR